MNYILKRHIIKIPKNITIYYCANNYLVICTNSSNKKRMILKTKLLIDSKKNIIKVTRQPFFTISNNEKKKLKAYQGTQVSLLKQMFLDVSHFFCKKLDLVGVGFRVQLMLKKEFNLLQFKLGFSHLIYFKIPKNLKIFCLKTNRLYILGNSYLFVTQIAALIRTYKIPEPYKGKGILYATETVKLKEGKKI